MHDQEVTNDKGTSAVGLVTGRVWIQTGATVNHINIDLTEDDVDNQTIINTLNLIGPGSTPNIRVEDASMSPWTPRASSGHSSIRCERPAVIDKPRPVP